MVLMKLRELHLVLVLMKLLELIQQVQLQVRQLGLRLLSSAPPSSCRQPLGPCQLWAGVP